jgi:TM2 domain-containing membrane protein YozV
MALDVQKQILIEQRVSNDAKSPVAPYFLCFFLGVFGAHRIYLGRTSSGIAMQALSLVALLLSFLILPLLLLFVTGIWAFIDLFLIGGMILDDKDVLRQRLSSTIDVTIAAAA